MDFDPKALSNRLHSETDRAFIIVCGSLIEDRLRDTITLKLDEIGGDHTSLSARDDGQGHTFAQLIALGKMLGILDDKTIERIDLIRAVRNVSAHSLDAVDFDQPAIREAALAIIEPLTFDDRSDIRYAFGARCQVVGLMEREEDLWNEFVQKVAPAMQHLAKKFRKDC